MAQLFTIGEEIDHEVGNRACPRCPETYPEPCRCGGLIHAAGTEEGVDREVMLLTRCDQCGASEDDLDLV